MHSIHAFHVSSYLSSLLSASQKTPTTECLLVTSDSSPQASMHNINYGLESEAPPVSLDVPMPDTCAYTTATVAIPASGSQRLCQPKVRSCLRNTASLNS